MNILLIEDEQEVSSFIKKGLEEQQYTVTTTDTGTVGLNIAITKDFDLIILDLMLPGIDGLEICKTLRGAKKTTPIIILTALSSLKDKVRGLENGADDYITKPFHFDELLARIKVHIRRQNTVIPDKMYVTGDLTMNCYKRKVYRNEKEIVLTAKEFTLLELLMANKNQILSRNTIARAVWGVNFDNGSNLIDVYMNFLRNKIDKGSEKKLLQTVVGVGYVIRD
ncbi:MAG TPA: response regulator transcription factor [Bacteroidia bacterium]|jgi:two-component system copper resistance phosphate regulon response regulator CusR|nr:response regulator transcription factor [Bacteroidia bacterium]